MSGRRLLLNEDRRYFSPKELLLSPFSIFQLILNIVASYCGVFFCFWLIFVHFGPDGYGCYSSQVLSPILISPFATPILALAWAPVGMLDAIERGWFGYVRQEDLSGGIWVLFPCFNFRIGVVRHMILGCQLALVAIPVMMLIVIFGIAEEQDSDPESEGLLTCYLTDWQQVVSCVTYIAILPIYVIPVGLLGFAREENLDRVYEILADKSFIQKGIYSPKC
mmetsp:Transcript_38769/g.54047  ORF Transcript_38769/g.54047 Transcript_38769/m.54047 type:complete len:222 (+) Transcript_38769:38-703(+)